MSLALKTLRQNVVSAKAASPSGPGSAIGVGTNPTRWASVAEVGSPVRTKRSWAVEASICTSLIAFAQEAFPVRRPVDAHNVRARADVGHRRLRLRFFDEGWVTPSGASSRVSSAAASGTGAGPLGPP